ncbi:MAG TPA: hypothetical protein VJY62_12325 [Bacteroidia bacterium]|nr:hypothetical protein [Bacteroidia bacterium]
MIKQTKLSKSILAFVIMLLCNLHGWTQAERSAAAASKPLYKETSATVELKSFIPDDSNPELSDLRLTLLKTKVDLEYRQSQNQLSEQEIAKRKETILAMENKVNGMANSNNNVIAGKYPKERKFTRAQFVAMSEADQNEIASNLSRYEITDLLNATPGAQFQENVFYIPVADFKAFDILKQIHIIKNPSDYVIVQNAAAIPVNTISSETPSITKYKISRAEFNTFPPEKKKAIENSKDFVITE